MQKKVWQERAKDGGVIPVTGFPRVNDGDKETSDNLDMVQTRASQTSQAFVHGRRLGVIPSKRAFIGTDQVRRGEGEVDVLGTFVVEVVVLSCSRVDGRGSRNLGDGSGTCLSIVEHHDPERVLGNMHVIGSCTQTLSDLTGSRSPDIVVHGVI